MMSLSPSSNGPHHLISKYHISTHTRHERVISNIDIQIDCRASNIDFEEISNYHFCCEICFENLYISVSVRRSLSTGYGNRRFYRNDKLLFYAAR
jgi:hypothetical protein